MGAVSLQMRTARAAIVCLFLCLFFILSTSPVIEGDLFWHIRSGEWIWQNTAIPDSDIYTYTSQKTGQPVSDTRRSDVILKGYWLIQPVFYLIYSISGIPGMIFFRASVIVLMLLLLYLWMRRLGVRFEIALIVLFLIGYYMKYQGDRPHYLSFLFFPIAAMLLESVRTITRETGTVGGHAKKGFVFHRTMILLPLLMLLWANMHGGYVMGVALIAVSMFGEFASMIRKYPPGTVRPQAKPFFIVCIVSIAASFLNPNGANAFIEIIHISRDAELSMIVTDHISPFTAFVKLGDYKFTYWILIVLTFIILSMRWRSIDSARGLALAFFFVLSLNVQRTIPFFLALTPLIAAELSRMLGNRYLRASRLLSSICLICLIFVVPLQAKAGGIMNFQLEDAFPVHAVAFLKETKPNGNLFNLSDWGGYLIMFLPEQRVFADSRRLIPEVEAMHLRILRGERTAVAGVPLWKKYLNDYRVDVIIIPSVSPGLIEFFPLVKELYTDDDFSLVYSDKLSLIYLRKGSGNDDIIRTYSVPKQVSLIQAINRLHTFKTIKEKKEKMKLIGDLYMLMDRPVAAEEYYRLLGEH